MTIEIQQPQPFDIVGPTLMVAGQAVSFEATLQWQVTEGHDQLDGFHTGGGGTSVRQYQFEVTGIDATAMKLARMFLTVFEEDVSDGEGGTPPSVTVPFLYGPLLVDNYEGWRPHTVVAGETLSGLAAHYYGDATAYSIIVAANPLTVSDPDLIFVGQTLRIPIGTVPTP